MPLSKLAAFMEMVSGVLTITSRKTSVCSLPSQDEVTLQEHLLRFKVAIYHHINFVDPR